MHYAGRTMIRGVIDLDEFSKLIEAKINDAEKLLYQTAEKAGVGLGQLDAILIARCRQSISAWKQSGETIISISAGLRQYSGLSRVARPS